MKLSADLYFFFKTINGAIKEADRIKNDLINLDTKEVSVVLPCYHIGYLSGCETLLHSIWPRSAKNEEAYLAIKDKIIKIQETMDGLCKAMKEI